MPSYEATLGCIDLASLDTTEENSSQNNSVGRSIIDLTGFDSKENHAQGLEEEELAGIQEEDLEEHMVVEDSIVSARREEVHEHRMVENSFETLREERGWLCATKKGKKADRTMNVLQIPADKLEEPWMTTLAWRRAALKAEASGSSCQFADIAEPSGSGEGVAIDDAEASDTGNSDDSINVSYGDEEDV
jgi:ribosomal protein S13